MKTLLTCVALLCSLLPAHATTYVIDGSFATESYDNWSCAPADYGCQGQHTMSNLANPLLLNGTVEAPIGGGWTTFSLNLVGSYIGYVSYTDGQDWAFSYDKDPLTLIDFTVVNGVLADGLYEDGTDADYTSNWQVAYTGLTGTATVAAPLPPALPFFAIGLLGLFGHSRHRETHDA